LILLGAFLVFSSLGAGLGKRTQKPLGAHQEKISIAIKENTAGRFDYTDQITNRLYCFLRWKIQHQLDLCTSMHHLIRVVSLLSFVNSLYFAPRNKKNLATNKRTFSYSRNKENSKKEDRLHVHRIWAKQ
jgi:hypothetical protein